MRKMKIVSYMSGKKIHGRSWDNLIKQSTLIWFWDKLVKFEMPHKFNTKLNVATLKIPIVSIGCNIWQIC